MSNFVFLAFFFCFFLSYLFCSTFEEEDQVIVLTDSNFDEGIRQHGPLMVMFYAPWCGHCKALLPEYNKAASFLRSLDSPIYMGKVDATENKNVAERFSIQGYPTLLYINGEDVIPYTGERNKKSLLEFINRMKADLCTFVSNREEFEDAESKTASGSYSLFYIKNTPEDGNVDILMNAARYNPDNKCIISSDQTFGRSLGFEPGVLYLTQGLKPIRRFDREFASTNIKDFVFLNSLPGFIKFTQENAQRIFDPMNPTKYQFLIFNNAEQVRQSLRDEFETMAPERNYEYLYVDIDYSIPQLVEFFEIEEATGPHVFLIQFGTTQLNKYRFNGEITVEALHRFYENVVAGKEAKFIRSDPIQENETSNLRTVVGRNFNDFAYSEDSDNAVLIYTKDCPTCSRIIRVIEGISDILYPFKALRFGKIDLVTNEIEDASSLKISKTPALVLFKLGRLKNYVLYDGEFDPVNLFNFFRDNVSTPMDDEDASKFETLANGLRDSLIEEANQQNENASNNNPDSQSDNLS